MGNPSTRYHWLRNKIVADELCAPGPTLENDLTVMKGFEFEAMTETNDGGSFSRTPGTKAPSIDPEPVNQGPRLPHRAR